MAKYLGKKKNQNFKTKSVVIFNDLFFKAKLMHNHIGLYLYLILESKEQNTDQ